MCNDIQLFSNVLSFVWMQVSGWIQFLNLGVVQGNPLPMGLVCSLRLLCRFESKGIMKGGTVKFLPAFAVKPYETSAVMGLLTGRLWPFQWKLPKFHTCNKTHRISSCCRFFSINVLYWLEFFYLTQDRDDLALNTRQPSHLLGFWLRPMGGQGAPGALPCLQHPGTAGEQLEHF